MNVVSAVKDHCGRDGGEKRGPKHSPSTQSVSQKDQKNDQARAKKHGQHAQARFGEVRKVRGESYFAQCQRRVIESRTVIFVGIVLILPLLPEPAKFKSIDR